MGKPNMDRRAEERKENWLRKKEELEKNYETFRREAERLEKEYNDNRIIGATLAIELGEQIKFRLGEIKINSLEQSNELILFEQAYPEKMGEDFESMINGKCDCFSII